MALEKTITNNILKYLNGLSGCIAEKVSGNVGQVGRADINGCINGQTFRIEVKMDDNGNKPTQKQLLNLAQWGKAGAIAFVAYSLEDVKMVIQSNNVLNCIDCYERITHCCPVRYCRWRGEDWKSINKNA